MIFWLVFFVNKIYGMNILFMMECERKKVFRMIIFIKMLKIMVLGVVFVLGLIIVFSIVYFLLEVKLVGVVSSDKNVLMFFGMDRDVNLKGICFVMIK